MKGMILIFLSLILGVVAGSFNVNELLSIPANIDSYILFALLFVVGISVGSDNDLFIKIRNINPLYYLFPIVTIIGTLIGVALIHPLTSNNSVFDSLAVGSGFGYYSLSSILITQYKGAELGIIALLSNIIREVFVLICAPMLVMYFGKSSPICCAGATSMDSTLPVISKSSGSEFVIIAIMHGIIVDSTVPLLVGLFCSLN